MATTKNPNVFATVYDDRFGIVFRPLENDKYSLRHKDGLEDSGAFAFAMNQVYRCLAADLQEWTRVQDAED